MNLKEKGYEWLLSYEPARPLVFGVVTEDPKGLVVMWIAKERMLPARWSAIVLRDSPEYPALSRGTLLTLKWDPKEWSSPSND